MLLFFGFRLLLIGLNAIPMGRLKVLLVYLVVGVFLDIIIRPLWVVSLYILVS